MSSNNHSNIADIVKCLGHRQVAKAKPQPTQNSQLVCPLDRKCGPFASISPCAEPNQIVEMIRRDFCSLSECEDDGFVSTNDFNNAPKEKQALKTYSKERKLPAVPNHNHNDLDDRLSCSSGLSVEETEGNEEPNPLINLGILNASNSQKICENLQNLGEYLSASYNKTDTTSNEKKKTENFKAIFSKDSIGTPTIFNETTNSTANTLSKISYEWSDNDSILADYNTEPSDDLNEQQDNNENLNNTNFSKPPDEMDMLSEIPLSEWQTPMEIPSGRTGQQFEVPQCSTESVGFWTASKKIIPVSETTYQIGSLIMSRATTAISDAGECDINTIKPQRAQRGLSRIIEPLKNFKDILSDLKQTESSTERMIKSEVIEPKTLLFPIEASRIVESGLERKETENTKLPNSMSGEFKIRIPSMQSNLNAKQSKLDMSIIRLDSKVVKEVKSTHTSSASSLKSPNHLTSIRINEYSPSDIHKATLACQQMIKVSEELKDTAVNVMAELHALELKNQKCVEDPGSVEPNLHNFKGVTFHTACKTLLGVSEQVKDKVTEILADLDAATSQSPLLANLRLYEFHTACKKMINVIQETKNVAFKLLVNVEEAKEPEFSINYGKSVNTGGKLVDEQQLKMITTTEANRSDYCITEESAALAEPQSEISSEEEFNGFLMDDYQQEYDSSTTGTIKPEKQQNSDKHIKIASESQPDTEFTRSPHSVSDIHPSLSQLANRSPLDKSTKIAMISRRNLLTLNRCKLDKRIHSESFVDSNKDAATGFAPISTHTSTPLVDRNPNVIDNSVGFDLKSNSGQEELSTTYTPVRKKRRRLGLSRMPNKS